MSKIGIITEALGFNYGAVLQNWALQQTLISLGKNPITIKHNGVSRGDRVRRGFRDVLVRTVKHVIFSPTRHYIKFPWDRSPYKHLHKFVRNHIQRTDYQSLRNSAVISKFKIDKIVVGSDQVWRPMYNGKHLQSMYCSFMEYNHRIPIISYAASFGVSNWEYSEAETNMAQKEVKKFTAISVREESAIALCKEYLHRDAIQVLDPTLLISDDKYKTLIAAKDVKSLPNKFVGVYILDLSDDKKRFVEAVCQQLGLMPYYFGNPNVDGKNVVSVGAWLGTILMSSFFITDSFHGTAFAINFHRPFISIANFKRGADRFESLLKMFGLKSRLVDLSAEQNIKKIVNYQIPWDTVEHIHQNEKQKALDFLRKYLC